MTGLLCMSSLLPNPQTVHSFLGPEGCTIDWGDVFEDEEEEEMIEDGGEEEKEEERKEGRTRRRRHSAGLRQRQEGPDWRGQVQPIVYYNLVVFLVIVSLILMQAGI